MTRLSRATLIVAAALGVVGVAFLLAARAAPGRPIASRWATGPAAELLADLMPRAPRAAWSFKVRSAAAGWRVRLR
ncbi:MAG TPA: hypothetical protein VFD04_13620, partial [Actinomycetes bacterium]|nr:hypothetical protein [Actinomycetes bacterium]